MPRPAIHIQSDIDPTQALLSLSEIHSPTTLTKFSTHLFSAIQSAGGKIARSELTTYLKEQGAASSTAVINERLTEMKQSGAIDVDQAHEAGKLIHLYTIRSIGPLLEAKRVLTPPRRRVPRDVIVRSLVGDNEIAAPPPSDPVLESLFTTLEAAMKLGQNDKRTEIACRYFLKRNDYITITASTSTRSGGDIARLSDQRVIMALNAMLLSVIRNALNDGVTEAEILQNVRYHHVRFDMYELLEQMKLTRMRRNSQIVSQTIRRLVDTSYRVDASESPYFRKRYLGDSDIDVAEYRYITEFYAQNTRHLVDGLGAPYEFSDRIYVVKFHTALVANMLELSNYFTTIHPERLYERSGLAHRINNWARAVVGVRPRAVSRDHHSYPLDEFKERVLPSARLDNFTRDFFRLVERSSNNEDSDEHLEMTGPWLDRADDVVVWQYGYYIRVSWDDMAVARLNRLHQRRPANRNRMPVITVWRDAADEYIGDNSVHMQKLRAEQQQLDQQAWGERGEVYELDTV